MKKFKISKPMRVSETGLDDLFDDSSNYELKAERLRIRRERRLRHQMLQY